jgi:sugar (pentulose or hexulose) kinase
MIPLNVIAIFDIGKTNKKFFLIDEGYNIVLERSVAFDEIKDEDNDDCDDVELILHWVRETLGEVIGIKKFDIKAVNFSAYGASLVYIDETGKVIAPLYNYLKKYSEKLKDELYGKYGGEEKISCETASPVLGNLNSGMQLYRIKKEKPELYKKIKYALHLPQFISSLITKKACSDITSIGCHTQLWNFHLKNYHEWVIREGIEKKLAPVMPPDQVTEISFNGKKLFVGTGLHDSSAALIPYLAMFTEPFILISTGTWCISLNPFNEMPLTVDELKKDCLCYYEYQGRSVKASRIFAGHEHEAQVKRIANHFKKDADYYKKIKYDPSVIASLKKSFKTESLNYYNELELFQFYFSKRNLSSFRNFEQAYHCLLLDIMQQQSASTQLVMKRSDINRIFVDGGFSSNSIYMHLLSAAFPQFEVYAASVAQASATGAALAIHNKWNSHPVPADMVKLKYYKLTDVLI